MGQGLRAPEAGAAARARGAGRAPAAALRALTRSRRLNLRWLRAPRAGSGAPAAGLAAGSGAGARLRSGRVAEEGVSGGLPGALAFRVLSILRVERVAVVPELSQAG